MMMDALKYFFLFLLGIVDSDCNPNIITYPVPGRFFHIFENKFFKSYVTGSVVESEPNWKRSGILQLCLFGS